MWAGFTILTAYVYSFAICCCWPVAGLFRGTGFYAGYTLAAKLWFSHVPAMSPHPMTPIAPYTAALAHLLFFPLKDMYTDLYYTCITDTVFLVDTCVRTAVVAAPFCMYILLYNMMKKMLSIK